MTARPSLPLDPGAPRCAICRTPAGLVQIHGYGVPLSTLVCLPHLEQALQRVGPPKVVDVLTCVAEHDSDDRSRFAVAAIWPYSQTGKHALGQPLAMSCTRHFAEALACLLAERTPTTRRKPMSRFVITTPVPDYAGDLGPLHFHAGRAEVDEIPDSIRSYCEQAGYTITDTTQPAADEDQAADAEAVVR